MKKPKFQQSRSEPREAQPCPILPIAHCVAQLLTYREPFFSKTLKTQVGQAVFDIYNKGLVNKKILITGTILLMRLAKLPASELPDAAWNDLLVACLLLAQKLLYDEDSGPISSLCDSLKAPLSNVLAIQIQLTSSGSLNRIVTRGQYVLFYMRLCEKGRAAQHKFEGCSGASTAPSVN